MNIINFIHMCQDDKELVIKTVEEAIENTPYPPVVKFYNYLKKEVDDPIDTILSLNSGRNIKELLDINKFHDELRNDFHLIGELYGENTYECMEDWKDKVERIFMSEKIVDFGTLKVNYIVDVLCEYILRDIEVEYEEEEYDIEDEE